MWAVIIKEHLNITTCLFQQIQTSQLPANVTSGATILNFSVTGPAIPTPPPQPSVPLEYQNAGLYGITLVTISQTISTISTQPGQTVDYTIPSVLVVTHQPSAKVRSRVQSSRVGGSRVGKISIPFCRERFYVHTFTFTWR